MNQDRSEAPLHVVVGATGAVGGAVVDELVRRGHRVRSVARHEMTMDPSVEQRLADVMDASQATEAIAGASVVYHCAAPAYTRWVDEFPQLQANVADAAERAGARLVVLENLYMYARRTARCARRRRWRRPAKRGAFALASARISCVGMPMAACASPSVGPPTTTVRALNSAVGEQFFAAVARGKGPRWLGRLDQPHSLSYLPDIAAGLVTLGEHPEADGEVWHLPVSPALTGAE